MSDLAFLTVRRMREDDLELVRDWRNHTKVRQSMLTQHEITPLEHRSWYDRRSSDASFALLLIEEHDEAIGCVIFSNVGLGSTAEWSFYAKPSSPAGVGTRICSAAIDFAFHELRVHKVVGQVLAYNNGSIRLHQRLGFSKEGILRQHCQINGRYIDLLCFGMLASEWQRSPRPATKPSP